MKVLHRLLAGVCLGLWMPALASAGQFTAAPADPTPVRALRGFTRDAGSRELPQSTVTAVHEDSEGVIWILTLDGIARIEQAEIERLPSSPDAPLSGPFYAIVNRRAGGIHVSGEDAVVTWNGSGWSRIATPVTFIAIAEDRGGRLIGVDRLGSVWEYASDRRWVKLTKQSDAASVAVSAAPDGVVYAAGAGGVREVRDALAPPMGGARPASPFTTFRVTRRGEFWAVSEDGRLWVFANGDRWVARPLDGWDGGVIHALAEDPQGRIWIGGERGRVAFGTAAAPFQMWTPANGMTPATVNAIAGDRIGGVWFGFGGFGLQHWLGDPWSHRPFWIDPRETEPIAAMSITPARNGFLAAVAERGIWRWNGMTLETFGAEHGLNETVRFAVEPEAGVIWAGTRRGLFESRAGGTFRRIFSLSVNGGFVNGIFKAPNGTWWAATEEAGIFIQDPSGWRPHLRMNAVLPDVNVRQVAWRTSGEVWVATGRGVAAYRGASLERITLPEPPPAIANP